MAVSARGIRSAKQAVASVTKDARDASRMAANRTARSVKTEASRRTRAVYAIKKKTLDQYISAETQGKQEDGPASVTLKVRGLPARAFSPRVRMRTIPGVDSLGRRIGRQPTVTLKIYRDAAREWIYPAFPLHQRYTGALQAGDAVRRRIGNDRDKLTSLRYVTFPESLRRRMIPALDDYAGDRIVIEFKAAWRKQQRGRTRLRQPD